MAVVSDITDDSFQAEVIDSDIPVIVDFWAEWCAPCRAIGPIIKNLADEYDGRVKVVKLNIDQSPRSPQAFRVMSIPTVMAFRDGQVVQEIKGARPKGDFAEMAEKLL